MAQIETFRTIYQRAGIEDPAPVRRIRASTGYDSGGTGRRGWGWNPPRQGSNTLLTNNLDNILARSRDVVRNNAWGTAAVDRWESNAVGTGIRPHWQHNDPAIIAQLQIAWNRWQQTADWDGQLDFYGLQALMAREIFEAGECFIRFRLRPSKAGLYIPLQLQLIESEQLPVFLTQIVTTSGGAIRCGIEFDDNDQRVAYRFYRHHPGDSMFWPDAYVYTDIPASDVLHVYKPRRAGQLRGDPRMSAVLKDLYELDLYTDAALVKKKVAAMMAGFVEVPTPESDLFTAGTNPNPPAQPPMGPPQYWDTSGIEYPEIEPGSLQKLLPGEKIVFSNAPQEADFDAFLTAQLHKFAAGIGMAYHQLTGDLRRINYSSIRAGLLEFRRAIEQFQTGILVRQACQPVLERWLREAVLARRVLLPNFQANPWPYKDVNWVSPGWDWVDPKNESDAAQADVRNGFTSREMVVRSRGLDPAQVDAQNAADRKRQDDMGLVYDSNPNKVLIGRETQPTLPTPSKTPTPVVQEEETLEEQEEAALHLPLRPNRKPNGKAPVQ